MLIASAKFQPCCLIPSWQSSEASLITKFTCGFVQSLQGNWRLSTYLINKAGFKVSQARTGAVTLIQRFGSVLNLNLHFHVLFIDGVFAPKSNGQLRFHRVNAPTSKELNALVATISERVAP